VYKRGRYWYLRYAIRGRDIRESTRLTNYNDAMRLLTERVVQAGTGRHVAGQHRVMVGDLLEGLRSNYEIRKRASLTTVGGALRDWNDELGKRRAVEVSCDDLERVVVGWRQRGKSDGTIRNRLAVLKRAFNLARQAGKLACIPPFPKVEESAHRTDLFERAEFESIYQHLAEYLKDLFEFANLTGVRKAQLTKTAWRNLNRERMTLTWEPESVKTRRRHVIPLTCFGNCREEVRHATARLPLCVLARDDRRQGHTRW